MGSNKIALVTGGSRGLGKNAAKHIAAKGIDVIITYRSNKEEAEAVVAEIEQAGQKAAALQLDTAVTKSFGDFFESLKSILQDKWATDKINILVNNAGINRPAPFAETTEEDFDELVNVHFKGVFFLTQKALPYLADGGRIINLSTGLARFSTPGYIAYASMKGAIEVFTRYLAKELGSRGITVNAVAPGIIRTDFTKSSLDHPGVEEFMNKNIALGRVGEPDDIGAVIAFLCTDESRWITAQRIEASGGMFL